jgi:hypothetical protein
MAKYTIYTIEGGKPTDVRAVKIGWDMSALKYGVFWVLYKKLWAYFFLIVVTTVVLLIFLFDSNELNILFVPFWWLAISFLSASSADEMIGRKLQKNFYKEAYVEIDAESEDEASKKYIREQALAEQFKEKEDETIDGEVIEDGWFSSLIVNLYIFLLPILTIGGIIILSKFIL